MVSGKGLFLACRQLLYCYIFTEPLFGKGREGDSKGAREGEASTVLSGVLSYKDTSPIMSGLPYLILFNLNYLLVGTVLQIVTLGTRASTSAHCLDPIGVCSPISYTVPEVHTQVLPTQDTLEQKWACYPCPGHRVFIWGS